jgi:hypothetical protein
VDIKAQFLYDDGWLMENMGADKSAENTSKAQNLTLRFVCPRPKVWDFDEKRLHRASVVRDYIQILLCYFRLRAVLNCFTIQQFFAFWRSIDLFFSPWCDPVRVQFA